jgi:hypothetical protein
MLAAFALFVRFAFLLLALLHEEFVADHLADDLLGASLRFFSDLVHGLVAPF